jgi:hypothetical protein
VIANNTPWPGRRAHLRAYLVRILGYLTRRWDTVAEAIDDNGAEGTRR